MVLFADLKRYDFHKYGTRNRLFDKTDETFGCAIDLFHNKYADPLNKIFLENKNYRNRDSITVFCEFFGSKSFAGLHLKDDPKELILFDIWLHKYGLLGPRIFVKEFGHLEIPKIIYEGHINTEFAKAISDGKYEVVEGVVCKGGSGGNDLEMCKIKTSSYKEKLKTVFGDSGVWHNESGLQKVE